MIGEGGSGGALALAVSDRVLMQENAIYSVITPGGLRDDPLARPPSEKKKAAAAFKPDAFHCLELGVIDGIVSEPRGGAQRTPTRPPRALKTALVESLDEARRTSRRRSCAAPRRAKFRAMGVFA